MGASKSVLLSEPHREYGKCTPLKRWMFVLVLMIRMMIDLFSQVLLCRYYRSSSYQRMLVKGYVSLWIDTVNPKTFARVKKMGQPGITLKMYLFRRNCRFTGVPR